MLKQDRRNTRRREHYAENRESVLATNRAYWKRHTEALKLRRRFLMYGTDGEDIFDEQKGRCAICDVKMLRTTRNIRAAHLDHDHVLGTVRGWLCSRCNTAIGLFEDTAALLRKAADYLDAAIDADYRKFKDAERT